MHFVEHILNTQYTFLHPLFFEKQNTENIFFDRASQKMTSEVESVLMQKEENEIIHKNENEMTDEGVDLLLGQSGNIYSRAVGVSEQSSGFMDAGPMSMLKAMATDGGVVAEMAKKWNSNINTDKFSILADSVPKNIIEFMSPMAKPLALNSMIGFFLCLTYFDLIREDGLRSDGFIHFWVSLLLVFYWFWGFCYGRLAAWKIIRVIKWWINHQCVMFMKSLLICIRRKSFKPLQAWWVDWVSPIISQAFSELKQSYEQSSLHVIDDEISKSKDKKEEEEEKEKEQKTRVRKSRHVQIIDTKNKNSNHKLCMPPPPKKYEMRHYDEELDGYTFHNTDGKNLTLINMPSQAIWTWSIMYEMVNYFFIYPVMGAMHQLGLSIFLCSIWWLALTFSSHNEKVLYLYHKCKTITMFFYAMYLSFGQGLGISPVIAAIILHIAVYYWHFSQLTTSVVTFSQFISWFCKLPNHFKDTVLCDFDATPYIATTKEENFSIMKLCQDDNEHVLLQPKKFLPCVVFVSMTLLTQAFLFGFFELAILDVTLLIITGLTMAKHGLIITSQKDILYSTCIIQVIYVIFYYCFIKGSSGFVIGSILSLCRLINIIAIYIKPIAAHINRKINMCKDKNSTSDESSEDVKSFWNRITDQIFSWWLEAETSSINEETKKLI